MTKTFVETYNMDGEGRKGTWNVTTKTYEEAIKDFNGWMTAVRVAEKTFDPETFTITTKVLKETENAYNWKKGTYEAVETIY